MDAKGDELSSNKCKQLVVMRARVHLFTAHTTSSNNQRVCSKKNV